MRFRFFPYAFSPTKVLRAIAPTLLLFVVACGTTVTKSSQFEQSSPSLYALLPVTYPSDIRPERAAYIRTALERELATRGFVLLDDSVTLRVCGEASCPGRSELVSRYGVDGFLQLSLNGTNRINFGAGFYNNISGDLLLLNRESEELVRIEHSESERGGLLFNSGQVIEGIVSTVDNTGDLSFSNLADEFAQELALKVPKSRGRSVPPSAGAMIQSVEFKSADSGRVELCASGSPGGATFLLIDRLRSALREVSPGRYCGIYNLEGVVRPDSRFAVELRSPYGIATQKQLDPMQFIACAPEGLVALDESSSIRQLRFGCDGPDAPAMCEVLLKRCAASDFVVYRSTGASGPFRRLGVSRPPIWKDPSTPISESIYAVSSVSKSGTFAVPVVLQGSSTAK